MKMEQFQKKLLLIPTVPFLEHCAFLPVRIHYPSTQQPGQSSPQPLPCFLQREGSYSNIQSASSPTAYHCLIFPQLEVTLLSER